MVETQFINAKLEIIREFFVSNGGLVILYFVKPEGEALLEGFYIASYEIAWGMGHDIKEALQNASANYNNVDSEDDYNPFEEVLIAHKDL